jgi:hypothetical protein
MLDCRTLSPEGFHNIFDMIDSPLPLFVVAYRVAVRSQGGFPLKAGYGAMRHPT